MSKLSTWITIYYLYFMIVNHAITCSHHLSTVKGQPPTFSNVYSASGVLRLPFAEIVEPFHAYYDAVNGRSRIDYYNGLTKTIHHAGEPDDDGDNNFGYTHKVFFVTTEKVRNRETCTVVNGTEENPISIQGIIPDISEFQYVGNDLWEDVESVVWHNVVVNGGKENKYTMWISKNDTPIHYEMMGYDTLLMSHYDKYEIDYHTYDASRRLLLEPDTFKIAKDLMCSNGDDAGPKDIHLHSPMKEFVHNHDVHVHDAFQSFKRQHGVTYEDADEEHEMRKNIFRQNHRFVHSVNRAGRGYQLSMNRFSDRTDDELSRLRTGYRPIVQTSTESGNGGLPFHKRNHLLRQGIPPDSLDWRLYGAVSSVKDQAVCGSCWSFAATGTIEGAYFLKTGKLVKFSEQALVDCSWGYGNNGCDGGNDVRAYRWIEKHGGIPTDDSYGPYLGADGLCHVENSTKLAAIRGHVNVTAGDIDALKIAIATQGPIAISFDAELKDFTFYSNGIYYNPKCKNGSEDLNHAVLAVGYGVLEGEPYWLIKNSWSTYWGNDGYFLVSQRDNICGIATAATYVILK